MNLPLVSGSFLFFTALVRTYFLADRSLPWFQVAGTLLLTNLSTEQLIGLNGAAAELMPWSGLPAAAITVAATAILLYFVLWKLSASMSVQ